MRFTIKDIAREANVSIATVSRVINNKNEGMSLETREKILNIMKKHNYVPSSLARSMITKKTNIIGLILPDINNPFFPGIVRGAEDAANSYGYNIILCNTDDNPEKEKTYIEILKEKCVDGMIYTSTLNPIDENLQLFKRHKIPTVFVDRIVESDDIPFIFTDGKKGMFKIVEYLIQNGHKEIAYIAGEKKSQFNHSRLEGYKSALSKYNIPLNQNLIFMGDYKLSGGKRCMESLLDLKEKFSAVACENDLMAIGALEMLNDRKIKVPREISITGYDNIFLTNVTSPKITTIAQPIYEMGYKAMELLIKIVNKDNDPVDNKIILEPELVIKDSVWKRGD
ncbi:transcriptional regulator, LacI family [Anaerovirgula multivorans]|uniref:Transcriptional regulator, LacI family n=1 Tax=Anaerovirgula multivorans TaxID=312168 RepID=A0A239FAU8_9FIRM|nr:LacI family DNA-binding transcriptional regulator [Anaerovirgula multivorans]SNS54046.1 transcriptional regulator, LacI family [Anaerovirgula multivorans]